MEHFSEQVFADFVRGVARTPDLQSHLANHCRPCTNAFNLWNQLQAIAARESSYVPPSETVRRVKLEFQARPEEGSAANLVFDSLLAPALAGVRAAAAAAARQMVYEAKGLTVDLRFDRTPRSKVISLIGQVLDQKVPRAPLSNVSVMLWTEKGLVVAETRTNGFGEFHMDFEGQNRLRLSIEVPNATLIRIPLANLLPTEEEDEITGGTKGGYC
jgi:hypothetical protein